MSTSTTTHSAADDDGSTTCPRCGQRRETAAFEDIDLDWARARDPHVEVYQHRSSPNGGGRRAVAICAVCTRNLDDIAAEMDDYRARLRRRWPLPPAWGSVQDDQRLSQAFERFRDSVPAIYHALAWAIGCQRRGATAYLTVYETDDWSVDSLPGVPHIGNSRLTRRRNRSGRASTVTTFLNHALRRVCARRLEMA